MSRSRCLSMTVLLVLAAALASTVEAEVSMTTDGVFRILCSDANDSQHPEEIVLKQNVPVADFEPFGDLQLGLSYDPDGSGTSSRGTVRAFVRQLEADGSRPLLDVFSARQDTATSEAAALGVCCSV